MSAIRCVRWIGMALLGLCQSLQAQTFSNTPVLPLLDNQRNFVDMRFGMFIHFNMGTYVNREWAPKGLDPQLFAPTVVDCDQWAAAAKSAGMKFAVLTTKHHDGFALWPTKYQTKNTFGTYQNVMYSKYPKDIVRLYVDAFRKAGVTPCLYFSIWDRNEPIDRNMTAAAVNQKLPLILGQLTELLTNYGDIPFIMFDGWTWETGRNLIATQIIRDSVRKLQPNIVIGDHTGMTQPFGVDILNFEHFDVLSSNTFASTEGFKISSDWFYYGNGTGPGTIRNSSWIAGKLKSTEPVWTNFLLNCPPNKDGILDTNIVAALKGVPALWKPNASRKALPDPGPQMDAPITPVAIAATSTATGFKPEWAIDGNSDWVSGAAVQYLWQSAKVPSVASPEGITLDLGKVYGRINLFEYVPSQARTTGNDISTVTEKDGMITKYVLSVSTDNKTFTKVSEGTWAADGFVKKASFADVSARYVKLEATATFGNVAAVIQEVDVGSKSMIAPTVSIQPGRNAEVNFAKASLLPSGRIQIEAAGRFDYRVFDVIGTELYAGHGQDLSMSPVSLRSGFYLVEVHAAGFGIQSIKLLCK